MAGFAILGTTEPDLKKIINARRVALKIFICWPKKLMRRKCQGKKSFWGWKIPHLLPGMSRLRWALCRHFFEFGALFHISNILEHLLDFEAEVEQQLLVQHLSTFFLQFSTCLMQYFVFETFPVNR